MDQATIDPSCILGACVQTRDGETSPRNELNLAENSGTSGLDVSATAGLGDLFFNAWVNEVDRNKALEEELAQLRRAAIGTSGVDMSSLSSCTQCQQQPELLLAPPVHSTELQVRAIL